MNQKEMNSNQEDWIVLIKNVPFVPLAMCLVKQFESNIGGPHQGLGGAKPPI